MRGQIKIGCCGFPVKREKYFQEFKVVEIQSTFYKLPAKLDTVKKWRKNAPSEAEFIVKAWQVITHPPTSPTYRRAGLKILPEKSKNYGFFRPTEEVFEAWKKTRCVAEALEAKIVLFQSPSSFSSCEENIKNLQVFFQTIKDKKFIFVWEPRGEWGESQIKNICRKLELVHCVDPFKQSSLFGKINYFRLHGKPGYNLRYRYTDDDLIELKKMCDREENYCMFNNLSMFEDAKRFKEILREG
ncbi:DUF72 domain-containing protein [Candidatus Aerophobetes bacterium]|nr:DUF72 domain-containing protein [Candidatus Aerophobetes bacterium]